MGYGKIFVFGFVWVLFEDLIVNLKFDIGIIL